MAQLIQANPLGEFLDRRQQAQKHGLNQQLGQQRLDAGELNQQLGQQRIQAGALSQRAGEQQFGSSQDLERTKFLNNAGKALLQIDESQWPAVVDRILPQAERMGVPVDQLDLSQMNRQNIQELVSSTSQFLSDPSKLTAAQQEFASLTEGFSEEEQSKARRVKAGLAPRATGSAAQTIAATGSAEDVAASELTLSKGRESGKLQAQLALKPKIEQAVSLAREEARERGELLTDINRMEAAMPGLEESISQLRALGAVATSTIGGAAFDAVVKQSGFGSTEGATARAKFIAIIDNQVLPLLKETFGAAFTVSEGESLKATMGDPDAEPAAKMAQLDAFIEQKVRTLRSKKRQVGQPAQAQQAPQQQTQAAAPQQRAGGTIMVDANGNRARVFEDGSFEEL
jgi:hypothetical protein